MVNIKRRKIICALLLGASLFLACCGNPREEVKEGSASTEEETTVIEGTVEEVSPDETEVEETLEFLDAHGGSHEVLISPEVKRHSYDWSKLTGSGTGLSYEDEAYTTRLGVDVSAFSGAVDWEKLKEEGVGFAIVRIGGRGCGEAGTLYEDDLAAVNIEGAKAAGLDVGVYFFSQAVNEEEAEFVLGLLGGTELDLPVVCDPGTIEDDEARTDRVSGEQFTKNALAFCGRIREAGYEPMVYCNMLWEAYELDMSELEEAGIGIWYADYEPVPQTPYDFSLWQFAEKVYMDGVEGDVDLNLQFIKR